MSGAPVMEFLDQLRELCRTGSVLVGAIVEANRMTFDSAGWSACPFCGVAIAAMVIAGSHAEHGGLSGGTHLIVPCPHESEIRAMKDAVVIELETGSMLPDSPCSPTPDAVRP